MARSEGADLNDCRAIIEEEIEVLTSIYGDGAVLVTRSEDSKGRACWQFQVTIFPWHLHVLIPSGLPYPWACPLLCPQLEDEVLTVQQAQRALEAMGATAQRSLGGAFIFNLAETLRELKL